VRPAPVYRHIERRQELFGLEIEDLLLVGLLAAVAMFLDASLPYALAGLAVFYALFRLAKRGKPAGYVRALLRFTFRPAFLSAAAPDRDGRRRPPPLSYPPGALP
jgi:hypothetical protein